MKGTLRHLLLAARWWFTQQAAQLHALSHVQRDLVKAGAAESASASQSPAEQCIAYHAVTARCRCLRCYTDPPALPAAVRAVTFSSVLTADRIRFACSARPS